MDLMDATFRPTAGPEVEREPDGTVEISFVEEHAALTILLAPFQVKALLEQLEEGIDARNSG